MLSSCQYRNFLALEARTQYQVWIMFWLMAWCMRRTALSQTLYLNTQESYKAGWIFVLYHFFIDNFLIFDRYIWSRFFFFKVPTFSTRYEFSEFSKRHCDQKRRRISSIYKGSPSCSRDRRLAELLYMWQLLHKWENGWVGKYL